MSASDRLPEATEPAHVSSPRRFLVVLPLVVFASLSVLLYGRLQSGDPSRIPSPLIGRAVPDFTLPPLAGRDPMSGSTVPGGLDSGALRSGHVTLVNVFASWCAECHDEHELLMMLAMAPQLKDLGVVLDGIVYKDKAEDARRYLGTKGDPYSAIGDDRTGRAAIDFGVYGVPETFVVKGDGTIAYKLIGPVTPDNIATLEAEIDKAAH